MMYAYTSDFDYGLGNHPDRVQPVVFDALVYALGEEYFMQGLEDLAQEKFSEQSKIRYKEDSFIDAIAMVQKSTPRADRGLREILASLYCTKCAELKGGDGYTRCLEEVPGFAADIVGVLKARG